jgi:hypothetical protein
MEGNFRVRVQGSGFRVQGSGFRVQGQIFTLFDGQSKLKRRTFKSNRVLSCKNWENRHLACSALAQARCLCSQYWITQVSQKTLFPDSIIPPFHYSTFEFLDMFLKSEILPFSH